MTVTSESAGAIAISTRVESTEIKERFTKFVRLVRGLWINGIGEMLILY